MDEQARHKVKVVASTGRSTDETSLLNVVHFLATVDVDVVVVDAAFAVAVAVVDVDADVDAAGDEDGDGVDDDDDLLDACVVASVWGKCRGSVLNCSSQIDDSLHIQSENVVGAKGSHKKMQMNEKTSFSLPGHPSGLGWCLVLGIINCNNKVAKVAFVAQLVRVLKCR